jgi:cardiolipin synthase C
MALVIMFGMGGCSLPPNQNHDRSNSLNTKTKWMNDPQADLNIENGLTAFLALDDAFLSMASRMHLIRNAQHQLDLQYYIWNDDVIGNMMLHELLKAADRGVKVRLLIDDQNGIKLDKTLKALARHPNFEIRIFNPYKFRHLRFIDYVFRLKQINHRMHNKLTIADHSIAVTGGRNISSEYFDAGEQFQFSDMDILFYGKAVDRAEQVFEEFWSDQLSYSTEQLMGAASPQQLEDLRNSYKALDQVDSPTEDKLEAAQDYLKLRLQNYPVQWAKAHFVADHPSKALGKAKDQQLLYAQVLKIMGKPEQHMELVSAYFVPTQQGTAYLNQLSKDGIKVRVLTNSLVANDVAVVHSFYSQYRKPLLQSGVQLYEFKPNIERKKRTWYEIATGSVIPVKGKNRSSLHAKFFDVDGKVFIGSFNFDPRSAHLNTEVGLVVESDHLQDQITAMLDQHLLQVAYQLKLDQNGNIVWYEHKPNGEVVEHHHDPESTRFQRFTMHVVSYFPVEWMM